MITEFVGMTAALSIFGVPPVVTVIAAWILMGTMVIQGRYWTWEKAALVFCALNLIYIPAAFMINPPVQKILHGSFIPQLPPGGFTNALFFLIMANIGTTIAPWMVFFQQSAVVDKNMQEKDMLWGKLDTAVGSFLTVVVAAGCVVLTGTLLPGQNISDAATAAIRFMGINKYVGAFLAIGLFDAGFLGAICISLASSWAFGEVFGWAHSLNHRSRKRRGSTRITSSICYLRELWF